MKLNPPVPDIPKNDPYANDLFNRTDFGNSLTSLFKNVDDSIVLSVDALWGDGKTTFAEMWIADLKHQGINCIYYDAFEHDYSDDPFVSFCAEIISLTATEFSDNNAIQALKEDFKEKAKRIGGKVLTLGARIGIKAISGGVISDDDADVISKIARDFSTNSSIMSELVGQEIEDYNTNKKSLAEFKQKLSELGSAIKKDQDFPLLIIVDELDRCKPDFALALIERIKHLFSTPNVSFLLLVNMEQMERYVETVYGTEVNARNYLHKFITISTRLPKNKHERDNNDYAKYTCRLFQHYGIVRRGSTADMFEKLFRNYNFTLREIERCLIITSLYYSQLPDRHFTIEVLISFLVVLKVRYPRSFYRLAEDSMSFEDLVKDTKINEIQNSSRVLESSLLTWLRGSLMSSEEFKKLNQNDTRCFIESENRYGIARKDVITHLCAELSKFSIADIETASPVQ